jgi:IS6 family transposase
MCGLKTISSLGTIAAGHAFLQNLRRGHYELTAEVTHHDRLRATFADLAPCL